MWYVKMLGLAVAAAVASMALLGAGSASATVLCKTAVNPCPEGWKYSTGTILNLSLIESGVMENSNETVVETCPKSRIKGKVTNAGSATETVSVALEEVTWGGITEESTCTVKFTVIELGEFEIHSIAGTQNGTVTDRHTRWTYVNGLGSDCIFGFANWTDIGTIKGGNPASLEIGVLVEPNLCVDVYRWIAKFRFTQPTPLYVESS